MQETEGKGAEDMGAIMARHATLLAALALILAGAAMARELPSEPYFWHNATPGRAGELWFNLGGMLYHSVDAGQSFRLATGKDTRIEQFGLGHPARDGIHPALYATGAIGGLRGVWRTDDGGARWVRINDDQHQWGLRFRAISGDPRRYGRVYIATDGRGLLYGDPVVATGE